MYVSYNIVFHSLAQLICYIGKNDNKDLLGDNNRDTYEDNQSQQNHSSILGKCDNSSETDKWQKTSHGHECPRLHHYEGQEKLCIGAATIQYKAYLCTQTLFGSAAEETDLADQAWYDLCKAMKF